jgi:hypothetical protein
MIRQDKLERTAVTLGQAILVPILWPRITPLIDLRPLEPGSIDRDAAQRSAWVSVGPPLSARFMSSPVIGVKYDSHSSSLKL